MCFDLGSFIAQIKLSWLAVKYLQLKFGEAFGLYQISDRQFIERLVKEIFERRKEIYLLEGDYDYDEADRSEMLNTLDIYGNFFPVMNNYCVYAQNVDAGVYIVVAKGVRIDH